MEEWKKGLIYEKNSLDGNIQKIETFLLNNTHKLDYSEVRLISDQKKYMEKYSDILAARIFNFSHKG